MIKLYPGGRFSGPARRRRRSRPGDDAAGHRALRRLHAAHELAAAAALHRRRRRHGADPVPAALDGRGGRRAPGDLLLRRAHRDRPLPPRGARGAGASAARLHLRPGPLRGGQTTAGPARAGSSPTSSTAWRTTSPRSTPTCAARRRWSTPPSPCSRPRACPRRTSTSTSSPPPSISERGASMATDTPVKERSVPKPVFTDAEAGAKEFPSSHSRSYNYFTPRKRRATVYEDVTVDVQPDPARHLTQGWVYAFANGDCRLPGEVDGAEVVQLARVPRPQRGVGADDLPQQRGRRPPDPAEHRARPDGARLRLARSRRG